MDCKKCVHLKRHGYISKCELFDNVTQYGEIGNEPIVKDCHSFKKMQSEESGAQCCNWRPIRKHYDGRGVARYTIRTDCGRVMEYGKIKAGAEIMGEICTKCGRLIRMHYVIGMED